MELFENNAYCFHCGFNIDNYDDAIAWMAHDYINPTAKD